MKKAQGATEYIIILAVVMIIIFVGLSMLDVIPGILDDEQEIATEIENKQLPVGIVHHSIFQRNGITNSTLVLVNNRAGTIVIDDISVIDGPVFFNDTNIVQIAEPRQEITLRSTQAQSVVPGQYYEITMLINYTDEVIQATFSQETTVFGYYGE